MAWGYWNATPAADRGRSPRKNKEFGQDNHNHHTSQPRHTQPLPVVEPVEETPCLPQESCSSVVMPNHSSTRVSEVEFEAELQTLSRRPSLDLTSMVSSQSALANILCQAHANKQQGGTLSAGNTLTRLGSRHTAVEYAVPHHFHHHHHAYVEYHQDHMSLSDDDSRETAVVYVTPLASFTQNVGMTNIDQVYPNPPTQGAAPGQGDDRSIYRRGARRWRKLYRINGHIFQAKRFNTRAFCAYCHDRIWGLGRQGFKCIQCKLLVHKKCHKEVSLICTNEQHVDNNICDDRNGETMQIIVDTPPANLDFHNSSVRDCNKTCLDKSVLLYEMLAGRSPFDMAGASENPDQNTEDYLFQVILEKTIRIPRFLSVKAANVLKGFLNKNPLERLGCGSIDPFSEITNHQFFRSINWELLELKQVPPPFKPRLDSDRDLTNFPPEFTDEPVHLTPDDPRIIARIDQSEFEGFEYVNPLLMSLEDCV
ncbi:hypothetical protein HUJ05_010422 [Dendroctonus ponderosae]|nr:hypothetical protein HUJ05_010422 [Dendroctonus ponderosae]KAH1025761.1 hypothetical protein HUJ05_010422 [Dendroctonus ponderosae]